MSITEPPSAAGRDPRRCVPSRGPIEMGPMSPLPGLPVVTAAFLSHGYAVG